MLNRIQLIGNLASLPEIRLKEDGRETATFSLTTRFYWKSYSPLRDDRGTNTPQKTTEWHHVTVYRESTISWIKGALSKGDFLFVEGRLCYAEWEAHLGQRRKTAHIVISHREGQVIRLRPAKVSSWGQDQRHQEGENRSISDPFLQEKDQSSLPSFLKSPLLPPFYESQKEEKKGAQRDGNQSPSFESSQEEDPANPEEDEPSFPDVKSFKEGLQR